MSATEALRTARFGQTGPPMERIDKLVAELTLEEKVSLCRGSDFMHTTPIERLGIPRLMVTDGPHGARGKGWAGPTSAYFPCGTALGATWDPELIREVGAAIGEQVRSKGASVLLGPTMNIHRSPLAGRNFECYSEDPYLTARIAVAYIEGVQSAGVGACAKHFVCNDSEFERHTISSEVDERTLREIYLPPFEAAVREAKTWWVMGAYNQLNGAFCCEHPELLNTILRDEWGFGGLVVSDWWALKTTAGAANGGCDLEMPGPGVYFTEALAGAVRNGEVDEATIDDKVRRLLQTMERVGLLDDPTEVPEQALDRPEDRALVRRTAAEAIVLLRNEDGVLPLDNARLKTLAVIGPNADVAVIGGGGSSEVSTHYAIAPLDGIRAACPDTQVVFERGCLAYKMLPELQTRLLEVDGEPGMTVDFFEHLDPEGEPAVRAHTKRASLRWVGDAPVTGERFSARLTGTFTPDQTGEWTFGLVAAGRSRLFLDDDLVVDNWTSPEPGDAFFGMASAEQTGRIPLEAGETYALRIDFRARAPFAAGLHVGCLPPRGDDMDAAVEAARRADAVVVVVGTNSDWETEGRDRDSMALPGSQDELIRRVAAANPNTVVVVNAGSPVTMDWADDVPAIVQTWFAGQECGNAMADVLFGKVNPCGKLPTTFPVRYEDNPAYDNYPGAEGEVHYREGVFVGYRHYDARHVEPRFPFGHGLSYTTFEYGTLSVERADDGAVATIDVTNAGDRPGAEVVQLYVRDVESTVDRPPQELKAFEKVRLEPGETKTVRFALGRMAFSFWDADRHDWTTEPGSFELACGSSSRDIRSTARLTIDEN